MWHIRSREHAFEWDGELIAYWEVALDPISDEYTPAEMPARDLLAQWARQVKKAHSEGLIPIHWFVESPGHAKFERMPFQYPHAPDDARAENFLTFFTWPQDAKTGAPLNWLTLPVVDKRWSNRRADKGGFIQEATGWKPSILQPFVYLPTLLESVRD